MKEELTEAIEIVADIANIAVEHICDVFVSPPTDVGTIPPVLLVVIVVATIAAAVSVARRFYNWAR